jgi:hypothetical protein
LDRAAVFEALYNASRPQGLGILQFDAKPMTRDEAAKILEQQTHFDYLKGRVMKIDLSKDEVGIWGYDRDNGAGAAAKAIEALHISGNANNE